MRYVFKTRDEGGDCYIAPSFSRGRGYLTGDLQLARVFNNVSAAKNAARQARVEGRAVPVGLVEQELPL